MRITNEQSEILRNKLADVVSEFMQETGVFVEKAVIHCRTNFLEFEETETLKFEVFITCLSKEEVS